jgi:hypothetical protein
MSVALSPDDPGFVDVHQLRLEAGWFEVAKGLSKVLVGHLLLIVGAAACGGLVALVAYGLMAERAGKTTNLAFEAVCYLGLGLLCISSLFGYGKILVGMWKCLKHAPERCGARWVMFACITCLVMGPTLNSAASLGGVSRQPEFRRGPREFRLPEFSPSVRNLQVASSAVGTLSYVLFLLFLRAVARCFGDTARATHVLTYLFVQAILFAGTLYVLFLEPDKLLEPLTLVLLGGGWVISFFWYLYLILSIRLCIGQGIKYMLSPLEYAA